MEKQTSKQTKRSQTRQNNERYFLNNTDNIDMKFNIYRENDVNQWSILFLMNGHVKVMSPGKQLIKLFRHVFCAWKQCNKYTDLVGIVLTCFDISDFKDFFKCQNQILRNIHGRYFKAIMITGLLYFITNNNFVYEWESFHTVFTWSHDFN